MRHQIRGRKLKRDAAHRKALLRSLSISLIENKKLVTTVAKAKELRRFVEPLITRSKEDSMHNRRTVFSALRHNKATSVLFDEIGPKAKERPGGYTRVIKLGIRKGDGAETALIELVDYNDVKPEGAKSKKKRTRRSGSKKKASADSPKKQEAKVDASELEESSSSE